MPGYAWALWACVTFIIPYQLYYNYILNQFYHYGVNYADSGLFAHLLWRNGWTLWNPYYRGDFSYFGVHFSPMLLVPALLSHLLPTQMVEFFAGWSAMIYASLGLFMYSLFILMLRPATIWHLSCLGLVAMALSMNTLVTQAAWLAHFEFVIPLGMASFLVLYRLGRDVPAAIALFITLLFREDAGFHLALVLILLTILDYRRKRSIRAIARELFLIGACIAYSSYALWAVQQIVPARMGKVIDFIYLGYPPLEHITLQLAIQRLAGLSVWHVSTGIAFMLVCLWSWRCRNPYLLVAVVANLPWLVVNLLAYNENTGALYAYYAFPFLLVYCWPLIAYLWQYGYPLPVPVLRDGFVLQLLLLLVGVMIWQQGALRFTPVYHLIDGRYSNSRIQSGTQNRAVTQAFIERFNAGAGNLGRVYATDNIRSLTGAQYQGRYVMSNDRPPIDTVIYMNHRGRKPDKETETLIAKYKLSHQYHVGGTPVYLYSNRPPAKIRFEGLSPLP